MKKGKFIPILLISPLLLGSCDFISDLFRPKGGESSSTSSETSESSSNSSSSSSSSSSSITNKSLKNISLLNTITSYYTGDILSDVFNSQVTLSFSDGSSETVSLNSEYISSISFPSFSKGGHDYSPDSQINQAGVYQVSVKIFVTFNGTTKSKTFNLDLTFNSVYEAKNDTCTLLSAVNNYLYAKGEVVANKINLTLTFNWQNHGQEIYEINSLKDDIHVYLYKTPELTVNVVNDPLVAGDYKMVISYQEVNTNVTFTITETTGFIHLNSDDLTANCVYIDEESSPVVENSKMLVIPINLPADDTSQITNWTSSKLNDLYNYYFGDYSLSLKNYYKTMSYGKIQFSGMIADVYNETSSDYTVEKINAGGTGGPLQEMCKRALNATKVANPSVNWDEYDQNNDKYFDNIHFITNYKAETWAGSLWPHVGSFSISGTIASPGVAAHSIGAINHMTDSITQIHEQGHIFGLLDYYDYADGSQSNINYIGGADMQSHNVFDWNSYSKMSCGINAPYVVDGSLNDFQITISDAATSPDCIVVPADYSTWNGSAFDEYFLIELFSNKGLNSEFWDSYEAHYGVSLGDGGCRLYHVDSRLFHLKVDGYESSGLDGSEVSSLDKSTWGYYPNYVTIGPNNSSDYTATGYGSNNPPACADYKQLALIQKGGVDTFGKDQVAMLKESDLFETGDTFTFNNYKHFLSKGGNSVTKMDNGETFPWTIEFVQVTPNHATIRFHK